MSPEREPRQSVILEFVNSFHLGGTEGQVVELLRGLQPRYRMMAAGLKLEGPHLATVRGFGIEPHAVPIVGSLARLATLTEIRRMASWLRREGVELVHAQDFYTTLVGVPAARMAGVKTIVSRFDLAHFLNPAQRTLLALCTRAADHVVANAEEIKRSICRVEMLPASRVSVIPNGIDLARFDRDYVDVPQGDLPSLAGKVVVVHVANMVHPVKAQEDLLAAMRRVIARRSDVALLLVGDGPRRPALERLARRLGVSQATHFVGRLGRVPAILRRAHIGVLCSYAEGLSNAIIEYMSAGLPVVATDAGGNGELVRDGESGYLVPVKSPAQLAERILLLAGDPQMRERMGRSGRAYVERELVVSKLIARHDALYRTILSLRPRTARVPSLEPAQQRAG